MQRCLFKICALALALALMPGAFEIMENAAHLLIEGHLAHAAADGDQHEEGSPEHGCTLIFHSCGCHASLAFMGAPDPPEVHLGDAGLSRRLASGPQPASFWPGIDHPPQV